MQGDPVYFVQVLTIPLSQSLGMVMSTKSLSLKLLISGRWHDSALIPTSALSDDTGRQKCQKTNIWKKTAENHSMNFHLRCDDVLILWLLMDFVAASWEVLASTFLHIALRVFQRPKVSKLWIPTEVQAVRFGSALPKKLWIRSLSWLGLHGMSEGCTGNVGYNTWESMTGRSATCRVHSPKENDCQFWEFCSTIQKSSASHPILPKPRWLMASKIPGFDVPSATSLSSRNLLLVANS